MSDTDRHQAICDRIASCSSGEIVAAANALNALMAKRPQPSVEEMARQVVIAALVDDGWANELALLPPETHDDG